MLEAEGNSDQIVQGDRKLQCEQESGGNTEQMVQSGDDQIVQSTSDRNVQGDKNVQS